MPTIKIANDLHIFAPHALCKYNDKRLAQQQYLIGDIVDYANCKKKELKIADALYKKLKEIYGECYVDGNHELKYGSGSDFITIPNPGNKIMLCHGHIPLWSPEKAKKWMSQDPGAGIIRRSISFLFNKWRDQFGGFKITQEDCATLARYAKKHKCKTIIIGHKHPKESFWTKHSGIKIVILKRGFNVVRIP